jgi:hypothetical protein
MYFLLQFLQKIFRTLWRNQINLVKNYNILQQTAKLIRYEVQAINIPASLISKSKSIGKKGEETNTPMQTK